MDNEREDQSEEMRQVIYIIEMEKKIRRFNLSNKIVFGAGVVVYPVIASLLHYPLLTIMLWNTLITGILLRLVNKRAEMFAAKIQKLIEDAGL